MPTNERARIARITSKCVTFRPADGQSRNASSATVIPSEPRRAVQSRRNKKRLSRNRRGLIDHRQLLLFLRSIERPGVARSPKQIFIPLDSTGPETKIPRSVYDWGESLGTGNETTLGIAAETDFCGSSRENRLAVINLDNGDQPEPAGIFRKFRGTIHEIEGYRKFSRRRRRRSIRPVSR